MVANAQREIQIRGAHTNNLKGISLNIPHNKLIVATGISGSGKSSLVFDLIAKEGQRRYFETLPSFARQFAGKLNRPDVDQIEGLSPVIAIGQHTTGSSIRSTVGTMSDVHDLLRLLFARRGEGAKLSRSLFSFNTDRGKCPRCNGIGMQEEIDLDRLISLPEKSIREGALAPTLPTGYIMYSQVTIDVLNQVCEAEGFNVDIPWNELTDAQRKIVLYGSDKIKVPFGKHSLKSRLKWTGIKAKPREEGHYKGMIPIMSDILRRDRNANILKYVHSITCADCQGSRLNQEALSVYVHKMSIADLTKLELLELKTWIDENSWDEVGQKIVDKINKQLILLIDLGLGHLTMERTAKSLSASEVQRIRVANQIAVSLSNVLYIFDEPSIGLHKEENIRMLHYFRELVNKGNTVIVVEHNLDTIRSADHIIDIGPNAGVNGGELLFNGSFSEFLLQDKLKLVSPTLQALTHSDFIQPSSSLKSKGVLRLVGCSENNLKHISVDFQLGMLNVVSGRSGAGKSSLVFGTLLKAVQNHLGIEIEGKIKVDRTENLEAINKLVFIDHTPIGKTPRSNPATYLGLSDHVRDIFASTVEAKKRGYTKSRFSFNTKGGRCETCQGAGKTQIGMHFLGVVDLVCETCNGQRFNEETLQVKYNKLSIAEVYRLSVNEAIDFFHDQKKVLGGLQILKEIGLGYLTLGQSSTTLSGGEAQRIKIANQLQKKDTGDTLYVIVEPSIGLHYADVHSLLQLFTAIKEKGNTIVCIEQSDQIIQHADWHIEVGPKSGKSGGELVRQGSPQVQIEKAIVQKHAEKVPFDNSKIILQGVNTHALKNIDVEIPRDQLTVVTGISGSGKSSLVYDTLFAEASTRFSESLSAHSRSFIQQSNEAKITFSSGLGPAIGINRKVGSLSNRSTVGTLSGVYDVFRLLYSRIAQREGRDFTAQHFSFNHHLGACPECKGLGSVLKCDPDKIILHPDQNVLEGAISMNKAIHYYGDPHGQFMATLKEVANKRNWDLSQSWSDLPREIQQVILFGAGDKVWEVQWEFTTKSRTGTQELKAKWLGLCHYIEDEYQRKLHNKNIQDLEDLMHEVQCPVCEGSRLKPELLTTSFLGKNIYQLAQMSVRACLEFIRSMDQISDAAIHAIAQKVIPNVQTALSTINELGLGYLSLNRTANSLSGGELQRINLAGQLSSHLYGIIYVLDEPTIGLDKQQVAVLVQLLRQLTIKGNTVVVVEHDRDLISHADYLIEMGPGAGSQGGEVVFQGKLEALKSRPESLTYELLHSAPAESKARKKHQGTSFGIVGASANNLKGFDVSFKSGNLIALTGVSGSGKSTLVKDVLYGSWLKKRPVGCVSTHGFDQFEEVVMMDQRALTANRLITPSSYTGILERIQILFASTPSAKERSLKKADFSYLTKNGKCPSCGGHGKVKTSMDFMSDIWMSCDACDGMRYNESTLKSTYKGKSVGEVLHLTISEALDFFEDDRILKSLHVLQRLGIGHLQLGQSGNTLSGGEAQRLKLATFMLKKKSGHTLYLFDEPSTGLHHVDILKLLEVFDSLVTSGDTVLFIEHNSPLVDYADQVITLGPGSGEEGGEVVG